MSDTESKKLGVVQRSGSLTLGLNVKSDGNNSGMEGYRKASNKEKVGYLVFCFCVIKRVF
jgi:hypothetical protein